MSRKHLLIGGLVLLVLLVVVWYYRKAGSTPLPGPPAPLPGPPSPQPPSPKYTAYPGLDSGGNDIGPWDQPGNLGSTGGPTTVEGCLARCDAEPTCKGVGWLPNYPGGPYCTRKSAINFPLGGWDPAGTLFVRDSASSFGR